MLNIPYSVPLFALFELRNISILVKKVRLLGAETGYRIVHLFFQGEDGHCFAIVGLGGEEATAVSSHHHLRIVNKNYPISPFFNRITAVSICVSFCAKHILNQPGLSD